MHSTILIQAAIEQNKVSNDGAIPFQTAIEQNKVSNDGAILIQAATEQNKVSMCQQGVLISGVTVKMHATALLRRCA